MTENNNNHPADDIEAYLDDELSPIERIEFESHVASCDSCRALLDASRQTRAELRSLFSGAYPSNTFEDRMIEGFRMGTSRRLHWVQPSVRRAALAAAAAMLLAGAGVVVSQTLNKMAPLTYAIEDLSLSAPPDFSGDGRRGYQLDADNDGIADRKTPGASRGYSDASRALSDRPAIKQSRAASQATGGLKLKLHDGQAADGKLPIGAYLAAPAAPSASPSGYNSPVDASKYAHGEMPESPSNFRYDARRDAVKDKVADAPVSAAGLPAIAMKTNEFKLGMATVRDQDEVEKKLTDGRPVSKSETHVDMQVKSNDATAITQPNIASRKIIRNANLQFEVDRFDDALLRVTKLVAEQGGFVAGTDSDKLPNGKMRGTVTLRVPPEHLDALVLELRGIGDLKSQKIGAEDVTRHYTDLESSLRAAHAMQDRLLEIIKSGKGQIKDLLEAEKQLGVWREKVEQIEGEKRYLDNLVSLSTLAIEMAERDIRNPAVATESEQVDMSLETDAVDKAYAKARAVIESAKGRILQSEMKQLDAGQFGATIRAAVPPDVAEQVIASLRQLDGRIAHFSRESHRKTLEGDASVAANTVRHDDAIIAIQIYNLANIAPRRTTNVVIAMTDVEKAYQTLLHDIQAAGGQVLTSSLSRPDANQQAGEIQVQLPADKADALELSASSLGETLRHESTENPDGANVTDAKRGFHFTIVSSTTIAARESLQLTLIASSVGNAFESIRQAVIDAGGRVTQSELNDQVADGQNAALTFDLPRTNLAPVSATIDKSTVLLSRNASRSPDTQNTIDSKLRFSLTINSAQRMPPRQTISLGSEVQDVNKAVADLTSAVDAAGGRRVDAGSVSQDHTGATTAEVIVELPAERLQAILDQIDRSGRMFNKRVAFDASAPQGPLSRARLQVTFSDSAKSIGGAESGWDAMRRGLETSAAGLRWSLQMLVIGACFIAPWALVIWVGWKFLRRRPRKVVAA